MKSIRNKILFPIVGVVIVCSIVIYMLLNLILHNLSNENMRTVLQEKTIAVEQTFNSTGLSLLSISNAVSKNQKIIDLIVNNEDEALRQLLNSLFIDLNKINHTIHTVEVTNAQGVILGRGHNTSKFGDDKSGTFSQGLKEKKPYTNMLVSSTTKKLSIDAVNPIFNGNELIGLIKVGSYPKDDTLQEIKKLTGSDTIVVKDGVIVGKSLDNAQAFVDALQTHNDILELRTNNAFYHYYPTDLMFMGKKIDGTALLVIYDTTIEETTFNYTIQIVQFSLVALLLILILIVLFISYRIRKDTHTIQEGLLSFFNFLNKKTNKAEPIQLHSKDEFEAMANVINDNILIIEKNITIDNAFIADVSHFATQIGNGDLHAEIKKDTPTPNLAQLKMILNEMKKNLHLHIAGDIPRLLSVLESYKTKDFSAKYENATGKVSISINELGEKMSTLLVQNLKDGIVLDDSTDELLVNVEVLSSSANEAAASLEETAAALEEITSAVSSNASHVLKMTEYSNEVSNSAKKGQELAKNTTTAMDEITEEVNLINEAISVIDQISFQTNILSLNAAVEAATAGEAGKGFAVVAAEVRNLASRSAEAAKEIKNIVEKATSKATQGKTISDEMIKGYEQLLHNINNTTQIISEIAVASKEQQAGINQINDAITNLDRQTQENANIAALVKNLSTTADKISKQIIDDVLKNNFLGKENIKRQAPIISVKTPQKVSPKPKKNLEKTATTTPKENSKPSVKHEHDEWESF